LPVTVAGAPLEGGRVTVRPEVSSQFVSALLLAAPLMRDGLDIVVDGPLPSRPYVGLTLDTLRQLGVAVAGDPAAGRWQVAGGVRGRHGSRSRGTGRRQPLRGWAMWPRRVEIDGVRVAARRVTGNTRS
jgi:5-enolpyruvylshikimate-3-phosphate synthase